MNYESELLDTKTKVMYNIAPNDKCVQTDFCEKKNYTIAQFEAYQVRRKKSRLNIKICLKEFSNSAHLTQNIESVHSKKSVKKKHPCKLCNKQFSRSDTLTKHIRTEHTGVMYPGSKNITNKISANQKQEKIKTNNSENNISKFQDDHADSISESDSDYKEIADKSAKKHKPSANCEKSNADVKSGPEHETPESKSESKSDYECKDCGKNFLRLYNLRRHVMTHLKKRPFNCEYCEKGFNRIDLLRRHVVGCYLSTDEGKQRYGRKISQQLLDELDQRVRKQAKPSNRMLAKRVKSKKKVVINPKPIRDVIASSSSDCDENDFDVASNATDGNINSDDGEDNNDDDADITMQQALCFVDVTMNDVNNQNNLSSLSINIKPEKKESEHNTKPKNNDYVSSDNTSDSEYEEEESKSTKKLRNKIFKIKKLSADENSDSEGSKSAEYKCLECGKVFTRERNLRRHGIVHSKIRPFSCDFCQKGFNRYDNLRQHIVSCYLSTEEGKKRYGSKRTPQLIEELEQRIQKQRTQSFDCKICGEACNSYKQMIQHRKVHTSEKPYSCFCGASFKRPSDLNIHQRIHTGERPFKCKYCDKGFKSASNLRGHERHHTGEKPFLCAICGKGYLQGYNLSAHMKTHTGENQNQCSYCPKKFNRPNDLKVHMRRHTGDFFTCDICGDNFTRKYHLKRHKHAKHGILMEIKDSTNDPKTEEEAMDSRTVE